MKTESLVVYLSIVFFMVGGFSNTLIAQRKSPITVAAAADLRFAMDSIVQIYPEKQNVQVIYGSSGKFFEQITKGAPFDIYFSADMDYPKKMEEMGKTASKIYPYGIGRLVLWTKHPNDHPMQLEKLSSNEFKKIAIANPRHAPYGVRAEESLRQHGVYDALKSKLVFGENISQAAQFVSSGAADIGIIALSLALSPNMQRINPTYTLISEESHRPLLQGAVITQRAGANMEAKAFFEFIQNEKVRAILDYFGFEQP
ncbi:molybdate ABC transporter substrate-binding protein [Pleomorphovibrio marinus]|uniref:molybdate ABC transporter substrate-binding protein n=1 Tax=Pleomorphovibrio marinus TaxID=2164132 RepID=UPI000E0C89D7|nr:molybdate ABC transporter substrate-binding protein [Pleomorphovibrio marinus]